MVFLFIHQNFPGQYRHLVRHLASKRGNKIYFITQPNENEMRGVHKVTYPADSRTSLTCHAYTVEFDRAMYAGAGVAQACRRLRDEGVRPDIVIGHSGWGETLFVKDVFPDVPLLANFEFFYHANGVDVDFDPEFASIFNDPSHLMVRNATNYLSFERADWGHSATRWQHGLYPERMQRRISVMHEGVDTDLARPDPKASFKPPKARRALTRKDEVLTYVARNLEPYRGFHIFMRALPGLLERRPKLQVLIVGGDDVSYGAPPAPGSTFRQMMLDEVGKRIDLERVHFLGLLDYESYLKVLQVSSAHVYLTYPFVLSWSFMEAMASGCAIIGSATPPVLEVLEDGVNGLAVDFFSPPDLARRVEEVLDHRDGMRALRQRARETAVERYDLKRRQLPRWVKLIEDLVAGREPASGEETPGAARSRRRAAA
jgi:glycosyltransferase involved in cell wall biosynthesis